MADKRFSDLSQAQWYFHYREILYHQQRERTREEKLVQALAQHIDAVVFALDRDLGKSLFDVYKDNTIKEGEITPENFHEEWDKMLQRIPNELVLEPTKPTKKTMLKTFNREDLTGKLPGLVIEPSE